VKKYTFNSKVGEMFVKVINMTTYINFVYCVLLHAESAKRTRFFYRDDALYGEKIK